VIDEAIHIQGKELSGCIFLALDLSCPKHDRNVDEKGVVGDMETDALPTTKAVRDVALLLGVGWAMRNVPTCV
jgi:hypothetical protein